MATSEFYKADILNCLHDLDDSLSLPCTLVLCGSASLLLQGIEFRGTLGIDLAQHLAVAEAMPIQAFMKKREAGGLYIDMRTPGMLQCLEDIEDRYVLLDFGFKNITLYVISLFDWVVSKLDSPKTSDIFLVPDVSAFMLNQVEQQLDKYCGRSEGAARRGLAYVRANCPFYF
jgi:hypothetical protein